MVCQEPSQVLTVQPAAEVIITAQGFDRNLKKKSFHVTEMAEKVNK